MRRLVTLFAGILFTAGALHASSAASPPGFAVPRLEGISIDGAAGWR